jgi:AmmeMemoRadiSam system protein B
MKMSSVEKEDIRRAAVSNAFYPGDPVRLNDEIDVLIRNSESLPISGEISALICPHAGYMYSGEVAAMGYRQLKDRQYSVVAVISPSHYEPFQGVSVFNGKAYETPLGLAQVAVGKADRLIEQNDWIKSSWDGHRYEHALEVQIPFLQTVLPDLHIIPIVMGDQSFTTAHVLGEALGAVLDKESSLIVASSDLSHRHPYEEANHIDGHTREVIESFDEETLERELTQGTCEACGAGPIIATMVASKRSGADSAKVLIYQNSGDVCGVRSEVVGYLSAVFGNLN